MYFDDIKLGMTVQIAPATIEKEKMLAFAHTYDNIPLHTDEEYAKASPFGALIAPGVMSFMSVWVKYLEVDFFGDALLQTWLLTPARICSNIEENWSYSQIFRHTLKKNRQGDRISIPL